MIYLLSKGNAFLCKFDYFLTQNTINMNKSGLLYKTLRDIAKELLYWAQRLKHIIIHPAYPRNPDGKVYIHLGCGEIASPEFINVDSRVFPHIHHVHSVEKLPMFPADYADMVYASHILEHIEMNQVPCVLAEWYRVLKTGGILRLGVPDFDAMIHIYNDNNKQLESIWSALLGNQDYKENKHYACFNTDNLTEFLKKAGFVTVRKWEANNVEHHNFIDWTSDGKYEHNGKKYRISLNIEAIKE